MSLRRYLDSMGGRLFLVLLIGVTTSACLALGLANASRRADLEQLNLQWMASRVRDFVYLVNTAPAPLRARMAAGGAAGLRVASGRERALALDPQLSALLVSTVTGADRAMRAVPSSCFSRSLPSFKTRVGGQVNCWLIPVRLADGSRLTLAAFSPRIDQIGRQLPDRIFLSILLVGVGLLAFLISRMVTAPLRDLSRAARALGGDLARSPLPEHGPFEVRDSIRAFNTMQATLRDFIAERTRILACITHDLQTPLTRLRLRLEKVGDPALRSRLVDDLGSMQVLIRQGLEFCRGGRPEEPFALIALDTLLECVVEDAAEGGTDAALVQRCGHDVEAQPKALQRCLANLLDNALKYGGAARVSAAKQDDAIYIRIRDFGPGIPPEKLAVVFEPFHRLENARSTGTPGVGLGLTIAKNLAAQNGAELTLRNHPEGGVEATLVLRRGLVPSQEGAVESDAGSDLPAVQRAV
ncbi:MAG TPA: ATP-binding protein [Steroidobacteraceae bacterium]|jgi:signal transduction histidine kinase|nr:ATP-binding protein [Steroidobacteraceae bacterium]